ncbi:MAG: sel1 repeat family protein, partial [Alphaproteobacteria bacterium]
PRTRIEPNTGATSTEAAEKTSSRTEAPSSHVADPAVFPAPAAPRSQQSETDAAQGRQIVGPQVPPIDTGALVAQGDYLLARSDIASARIFYQRAAEAGDGRGALRMGMTFDRVFLVRWRLRGIQADRAQAISWYRRASALGNAEAELIQREAAAQPPRVAAPGQRTSHRARRAPAPYNAKRS